jgi:hypothetical protein
MEVDSLPALTPNEPEPTEDTENEYTQDTIDYYTEDKHAAEQHEYHQKHHASKTKGGIFEHRHYVAFHPTCNKLLAKRWEEHARELHYQRLRQARPTIDNSQPRVYPHLEMRLKRLQMEEGGYSCDDVFHGIKKGRTNE